MPQKTGNIVEKLRITQDLFNPLTKTHPKNTHTDVLLMRLIYRSHLKRTLWGFYTHKLLFTTDMPNLTRGKEIFARLHGGGKRAHREKLVGVASCYDTEWWLGTGDCRRRLPWSPVAAPRKGNHQLFSTPPCHQSCTTPSF
jgi:hypothetical protein